jgi:HEAT repeat protein
MSTTPAITAKLDVLASSDTNEFRHFLRRLRKVFPEQAAEASLAYMAAHGPDPAAQSMAYWLSVDQVYITVLLDPEALTPQVAAKAVPVVKEIDPQFTPKFTKAVGELTDPAATLRALGLLPALGDFGFLIPWLRSLNNNTDLRVRSRAAKLLCELRPNKGLIERQMQSDDPRVRAGAIEVLWNSKTEDARLIFRSAVSDPHHRVVSNALVGLYLLGDEHVLNDMIELCAHKDHLFRSATAWAMAHVKDPRAIPVLQELVHDRSAMVRKRAAAGLVILESILPPEPGSLPTPPQSEPPQSEPPPSSPAAESTVSEAGLKLCVF